MNKTNPIEHDFSKEEKIAGLLEQISAYIEHYHNGNVKLIGIEGNTIRVRLGGACENCSLSAATLQGWVAGTVRQFFPEMVLEAVVLPAA
jgi:Fe-S cluster biogenesis protein NfuA